MYDATLIEAIDRIIAKTPEKLSKNAELIDVLMRCKAVLTASQEMTAREFLHQTKRMCKSLSRPDPVGPECSKCDFLDYCVEPQYFPSNFEDCITVVKQWAKEHPENPEKKRKTYAEDFKEKFPNACFTSDGHPEACRNAIYRGDDCWRGGQWAEDVDCTACWNEVMEGEE